MIKFKCSQCAKVITAGDEHAGRKAKCPGCQTVLVIPKPRPAPAPIKLETVEVVEDGDEAPPPRKPAPRPVPKPAVKPASPGIKAGKPRPEEYEELEEVPEVEAVEEVEFEVVEEEEVERPRKKARPAPVEEEEEELPRARRRAAAAEEDDVEEVAEEEEEEDRPRKKRRKKRRRWHGEWADCPNCGAPGDATRLWYTFWGGFIGPLLICCVRCNRCGTGYNGKTGGYNTVWILLYFGILVAVLAIIGVLGAVAESMK